MSKADAGHVDFLIRTKLIGLRITKKMDYSFIFFTMVSSVEQNTFIVVFYFRNGRFINGDLSVCKNEFHQNIRTTFKMIVC
jgi:hypothetical protein